MSGKIKKDIMKKTSHCAIARAQSVSAIYISLMQSYIALYNIATYWIDIDINPQI